MSQTSSPRSRGVRLTEEAVVLLEQRLQEVSGERASGKLTRRKKAELLQVSEKTADRLLLGERVDRATAALAFQAVGLEFGENRVTQEAAPEEPEAPRTEPKNRRFVWVAASVVFLAITGYALMSGKPASSKPQPIATERRAKFFDDLAEATALYHAAKYDAAKERLVELIERSHKSNTMSEGAEAQRMLGDVYLAQGNPKAAATEYRSALEIRRRAGEDRAFAPLQQALAAALLKLGETQEAKKQLRESIEGYLAFADYDGVCSAQVTIGEACVKEGEDDEALTWFTSARAGLGRSLNEALVIDIRSQEAQIYARQGKGELARETIKLCQDYWANKSHPRWSAAMNLRAARIELSLGNPSVAKPLLKKSLEGYKQVGDLAGASDSRTLLDKIERA